MKLEKGKKYDLDNIKPIWWNEHGITLENAPYGYNCWQYFDNEKRYLGPDIDGIEPEFELTAEPYASKFARKGGQAKSPAKTAAARENAKKGGRPRKNFCPICKQPGPGKLGDAFECETCAASTDTEE